VVLNQRVMFRVYNNNMWIYKAHNVNTQAESEGGKSPILKFGFQVGDVWFCGFYPCHWTGDSDLGWYVRGVLCPVPDSSIPHRWRYSTHLPLLPTLSVRPTVSFHRPMASTELYWIMTERHMCVNNLPDRYMKVERLRVEPVTLCDKSYNYFNYLLSAFSCVTIYV